MSEKLDGRYAGAQVVEVLVLRRRVDQLRAAEVSSEGIGKALGVSRQAARERFR